MKMVKSLLLGSAAGFVAVAGAQAADLPVKAKAAEYVKICSLYGAGFYYIPGTDICMKVGGYVRYQANFANGGASASNGPTEGTGGLNDRKDSNDIIMRTRAVATFDSRQQTQYGVLRTYLLTGFQQDTSAGGPTTSPSVYITRGFIQIAGFTFGKAVSFYDFFPRAALAYHAGNILMQDTGDGGQMLAAYTAQFGGGVSATVAIEHQQSKGVVDIAAGAASAFRTMGTVPGASNLAPAAGIPDIVGNIRFDGTWGSFQLSGVLHNASASYYGGSVEGGHPGDKWGWGVSPGLRINTPFISPGDYLVGSFSYTVGAPQFAISGNSGQKVIWNGGATAFGWTVDGVYGASPTGIELTTAWSTALGYEHKWTPALATSLYGSYAKISYNANAAALICTTGVYAGQGGCDPGWSMWNIGSRTQWNVTKEFYVGLDVVYAKLKSSTTVSGVTASVAQGAHPAHNYAIADQSAWNFAFRAHRDIVP